MLKAHRPLFVALLVAAVLLFTGLGRDYLWSDEADTAVLASTILKAGLPKAWDGVTFTESDHGERLTDDLVMVSHPWLQYYLVAASFAVFGESPWAARLPFVLAGLATIVVAYLLTIRASASVRASVAAVVMLIASVQFLVYSRQARNYSLNALLTCLLLWQFFRLRSWRGTLVFAAIAILLFHTHPIGLAAVGALTLLTIVLRPFAPYRPWCLRALPVIAVFTLPWMVISWRGYGPNTFVLQETEQLLPRLAQFLMEYASLAPLVASITLYAIARVRRAPPGHDGHVFRRPERWLVIAIGAIVAAESLVMAVSQSRDAVWTLGLRYTPAFLPFTMIVAALLVHKVAVSRFAFIVVLVLLSTTRIGRLTPWMFWEEPTPLRDATEIATGHQPRELVDRIFRTSQIGFLRSLVEPNPGTIAHITEFLKLNARPGDLLVTNYGWDSLYFHTRLPQAMKVTQTDSIYEHARALGLPDYVFGPGKVRWIVWRRAWGRDRGQDCEALLRSLTAAGAEVRLMDTVPETLWENRENIHFRRYPGNQYVFPWFETVPDAQIYRIDWPMGS